MSKATRYSTEPDRKLAERLTRNGDEVAFRTLYRRHTPAVYGLVSRMLGDSAMEADDVVQDAWMRAVRALPAFRWESTLRTWLTGIAVNRVRELYRRRMRRPETTMAIDEVVLATSNGATTSHSDSRADAATMLDLESALKVLPVGYRTVLLLHDWEGYTHPEISERLDIAVGTSKSQLFHARRTLRRLLDGQAATGERGAPA